MLKQIHNGMHSYTVYKLQRDHRQKPTSFSSLTATTNASRMPASGKSNKRNPLRLTRWRKCLSSSEFPFRYEIIRFPYTSLIQHFVILEHLVEIYDEHKHQTLLSHSKSFRFLNSDTCYYLVPSTSTSYVTGHPVMLPVVRLRNWSMVTHPCGTYMHVFPSFV